MLGVIRGVAFFVTVCGRTLRVRSFAPSPCMPTPPTAPGRRGARHGRYTSLRRLRRLVVADAARPICMSAAAPPVLSAAAPCRLLSGPVALYACTTVVRVGACG